MFVRKRENLSAYVFLKVGQYEFKKVRVDQLKFLGIIMQNGMKQKKNVLKFKREISPSINFEVVREISVWILLASFFQNNNYYKICLDVVYIFFNTHEN